MAAIVGVGCAGAGCITAAAIVGDGAAGDAGVLAPWPAQPASNSSAGAARRIRRLINLKYVCLLTTPIVALSGAHITLANHVAYVRRACYHCGAMPGRSGGMADATVLKTVGGDPVRVQFPSPALDYKALKRLWVCLIDGPEAFCVANHVAKVPDP